MKNSHTFSLIAEAFLKVQEFNHKKYISTIVNHKKYITAIEDASQKPSKINPSGGKHIVNKILERFNLVLMRKGRFEEFVNQYYSPIWKWNSVETLQLALKDPKKFDEVYNMLTDGDSKTTFDWFIKYRVAYAFVGALAGEFFPPKITQAEFSKQVNGLKFNMHNNLINLQNFCFSSNAFIVAETWIFRQYELEGKCEISEGDYIIDGGAFKGETSFWFLSKGARKIYAFEPDSYSFSILSKNIKRNKVSDKIIPVKKVLTNRIGSFSMYATGDGDSIIHKEGNKTVEGITLDSFVEKEGINKLDFIKLDVEGAELEVLKGAVETIKRLKPKMAITVYHKPEDLTTISKFILEILPEARFYLTNTSYDTCGTVLFVNSRET